MPTGEIMRLKFFDNYCFLIVFLFVFHPSIYSENLLKMPQSQTDYPAYKKYSNQFLHRHQVFKSPMHIMCVTIPKCGTHLLHRCLVELNLKGFIHPEKNGVSDEFKARVRALNQNPPPHHYRGLFHIPTVGPIPEKIADRMERKLIPHSFWSHWPYTPESEELFEKYCKANFIMIRDPRPMCISMVHMVCKGPDGETCNFEESLMDLIDGGQRRYLPWAVEEQTAHPLMWELGLVEFYKLYLPWMESKTFCTVYFEKLVGKQGGGSEEEQIQEIKKIAAHCGKTISTKEAKRVAEKIFGGTSTFRQGSIDGWKESFSPEIINLFKQTPGANQLLIDLGYEENEDW